MTDAIQSAILAAFSAALERVISQAMATHVQDLQARLDALEERIDTQEKNEDALVRRIAVLENPPAGTPATITADAFVTHLDNQEWFWEKLTRKAHEIAESAAEEALDSHTSDYDHDEYDSHLQDDDRHPDSDIEDAVRSALNGTSVTLSF